MIVVPVRVKRSTLQGKGVFAAKAIRKGAVVVRMGLKERHYTRKQLRGFSRRYRETLKKYGYWEGADKFVYPTDEAKYLNHSCEANVVKDGRVDRAARNIRAGEELTYDYGVLRLEDERFACRCGSRRCRGVITGKGASRQDAGGTRGMRILRIPRISRK
jgi:hypothetical protein